MARPKEKLYIRFRTNEGKQSNYYPAAYDNRGRLRLGWCKVNGIPEHRKDVLYYARVKRPDGKWAWEARGSNPVEDAAKAETIKTCQKVLWGTAPTAEATKPLPAPETSDTRTNSGYRLEDEVKEYLANVAKLAPKTHNAYKLTLDLFRQSCRKIYMHQITVQDLQSFDSFLMEQGHDDRTRHNRVGYVVTFLRNKEGRRLGPRIEDVKIKIKYVERPPEAYTRQELQDLFRVSSDEDKFLWRFLLSTGLRESEASVAEVTDVNEDTKSIRVDEKPWFGFRPKDCEKRSIPIPDDLIKEIAKRANSGSCSLLFPVNNKPDGHLLRRLKQAAYKGGLNCGKCIGTIDGKEVSCANAPVCEKWILHRCRKNFATDRHNAGAPARKIQKWLGHSDLETTLRYLAVGEDNSDEVRAIVNGVHEGLWQ